MKKSEEIKRLKSQLQQAYSERRDKYLQDIEIVKTILEKYGCVSIESSINNRCDYTAYEILNITLKKSL